MACWPSCRWLEKSDERQPVLCSLTSPWLSKASFALWPAITFAVVSTVPALMPNLRARAFCLSASDISAGAAASVTGASAGLAVVGAVSAGAGAAADHTMGCRACADTLYQKAERALFAGTDTGFR